MQSSSKIQNVSEEVKHKTFDVKNAMLYVFVFVPKTPTAFPFTFSLIRICLRLYLFIYFGNCSSNFSCDALRISKRKENNGVLVGSYLNILNDIIPWREVERNHRHIHPSPEKLLAYCPGSLLTSSLSPLAVEYNASKATYM